MPMPGFNSSEQPGSSVDELSRSASVGFPLPTVAQVVGAGGGKSNPRSVSDGLPRFLSPVEAKYNDDSSDKEVFRGMPGLDPPRLYGSDDDDSLGADEEAEEEKAAALFSLQQEMEAT